MVSTIRAYAGQRACKDMQFASLELLDGGINSLLSTLCGNVGRSGATDKLPPSA